jgi:hypothetical protein
MKPQTALGLGLLGALGVALLRRPLRDSPPAPRGTWDQLAERLGMRAQPAAPSSPAPGVEEFVKEPLWRPAKLTEFHPDAPASQRRREGGPFDRFHNEKTGEKHPVITVDQHMRDRSKYPFVTVAADTVLQGHTLKKGHGPRVYFRRFPEFVFRIFDTGGHFFGDDKRIKDGREPFDIATEHQGAWRRWFSETDGGLTDYFIDWADVLPYPKALAVFPQRPGVA